MHEIVKNHPVKGGLMNPQKVGKFDICFHQSAEKMFYFLPGPDVQMQASAGGAVMVATPQAFEYPIAGQLFSPKRKSSPGRRRLGSTAFQTAGSSGTIAISKDSARGTK